MIVGFMSECHFSFLMLGETWLKPSGALRHPSTMFDLRYPSQDPSEARDIHGLMAARNPKLTRFSDFEEVKKDGNTTRTYGISPEDRCLADYICPQA